VTRIRESQVLRSPKRGESAGGRPHEVLTSVEEIDLMLRKV